MKLTGELKDKVEQTANLEDAKDVIAKAGMILTDDEVGEVTGGSGQPRVIKLPDGLVCPEGVMLPEGYEIVDGKLICVKKPDPSSVATAVPYKLH